jgi:hypothetical protein
VDLLPKDFIKRLLVLAEDDRLTASEALAHAWFSNDYYTEDLQDLYTRSVQDWRPRPKDSQLVERISRSLPDLSVIGLRGHAMNQDTVSRFFHPSEQVITQSIMQTLSASQHRREGTPLPSISYDYANDEFLFASQAAPFSYETNNSDLARHYDDAGADEEQQPRIYDEYGTAQFDDSHQNSYIYADEVTSRASTEAGQTHHPAAATGMYSATDEVAPPASYASTESLNNANAVAYSQGLHAYLVRPPQVTEQYEVVLVHGTPASQSNAHTESTQEGSYQQILYPEEHLYPHDLPEQEASILVYETPPTR